MGTRHPGSTSIVTARVPAEIRRQGNAALRRIGSTPTELVNAAYAYVLERGQLPATKPDLSDVEGKRRSLSSEQRRAVRERMDSLTFAVPESYWQAASDEEMLERARRDKYGPVA